MKIDKKQIISTTIMFIVIVLAIVGFKSVFGDANTLVGVAGITAALSLLGTDYTINPIRNTIGFVLLEVLLGVAAYLSSTNAVLGLIITFIVIFFILYSFTYNTKKPTYVAFTLGYLFMLYTPVSLDQLPLRLEGLAFCGLAIMILQFIANKDKLKKGSKVIIKDSINIIDKEIVLMIKNENLDSLKNLNDKVYSNVRSLSSDIYRRIDKDVDLPMNLMQVLFVSNFLESINLTLDKIRKDKDFDKGYEESLKNIKKLLSNISDFVDNSITVDTMTDKIKEYLNENKDINSKYYLTYELYDAASILKHDLNNTKDGDVSKVSKKYFLTNFLGKLNELKNNMHKDSLKFTFALRGALLTSIGVFIVSAFDIEYGKWLVFSLSSVVQPYLESGKLKGKERLIGTIIGLLVFEILFFIVKDPSGRTLIILVVGYLSNYQTIYKYQMICTTISALGSAALSTGNIETLSIDRIIFVITGTLIALYANKFILPYKMTDVTKNEVDKSIKLNENIVKKLYELGKTKSNIDKELKELLVINELINKKIGANNATLLSDKINDFLYNQRIFMNEVRFLVNNFRKFNKRDGDNLKLFEEIDSLNKKDNITKEDAINYFEHIKDNFNKLILVDFIEIKENIQNSRNLFMEIEKEI
ncbi:FUSC family protein [Paraclostridium sordellii]|uniref:FUSC family protein n=1 Tax=Paraclostridium sordellii TaxID=1505 RepID=UPI0005DCD7CE|nr:FUSC family protein [Paeniclostridium sordellii]CEO20977.1 membrane protein [[Clostridium] sordellii] [Paeniclostridium sordellii]